MKNASEHSTARKRQHWHLVAWSPQHTACPDAFALFSSIFQKRRAGICKHTAWVESCPSIKQAVKIHVAHFARINHQTTTNKSRAPEGNQLLNPLRAESPSSGCCLGIPKPRHRHLQHIFLCLSAFLDLVNISKQGFWILYFCVPTRVFGSLVELKKY